MAFLAGVGDALLDFIYPPKCYLCGAVGAYVCDTCIAAWPVPETPRCTRCGDPAPTGGCVRCARGIEPLVACAYPCVFAEGAREAVHLLKYAGKRRLAAPMARAMAASLPSGLPAADAVVPLPLHRARLRKRGYNQAEWLAVGLGALLGLPVLPCLVRIRDTRSQVGLSFADRAANVLGAFAAAPLASGRQVLLVDDVCTTGATAREAARALRAAGTASVVLITFARDL